MSDKIDDLLSLAADMESCIPAGDGLTKIIDRYKDDELSEADLTFVAAAGSEPNFETFRKHFRLDSKK